MDEELMYEEAKRLFNQIAEGRTCYVPDYLLNAVFDMADEKGYIFACIGRSKIEISDFRNNIRTDLAYLICWVGSKTVYPSKL